MLGQAFATVPVDKANTWVGVAGTITTLSAVSQDLPGYDPDAIHLSRLSDDEVDRTAARLLGATREQRAALGPMHPGRVDVIGGGALITQVLAAEFASAAGISELLVSEHDILDGIVLSLL